MKTSELLVDAFGRIPDMVHGALEDLTPEQLTYRVDRDANSIAWLVWHLSRIEDDHVARVAGWPQVWTSGGWAKRWRLPFDDEDVGYGHTSEQVAAVTGDAALLRGYFDAQHAKAMSFVASVTDADLDRVVDERWDPPVTLGVRLVSVAGHNFEQAAQADFVRGIIQRSASP
ncbi:MAG TPA: DinB family protein [Candidatus Dormibacteraeota bacterium]|nr:DinB family protein [Candidatus Dormibacteraeota bacterium]